MPWNSPDCTQGTQGNAAQLVYHKAKLFIKEGTSAMHQKSTETPTWQASISTPDDVLLALRNPLFKCNKSIVPVLKASKASITSQPKLFTTGGFVI